MAGDGDFEKGSNTLLNVVSLLVLLPVVLILALRFGPFEYRVRALTTWMYLSGKGEGCDLERAWNPIELEAPTVRARLEPKVRQLDSDGPFEVWETPSGRWWTPPSTPVMLLLVEQEIDVYSASDGGVSPATWSSTAAPTSALTRGMRWTPAPHWWWRSSRRR